MFTTVNMYIRQWIKHAMSYLYPSISGGFGSVYLKANYS